jgi:Myb-like DNA-binding domain
MIPGSRDLSENLVDVKEYFGDDFKPPCTPDQVLTLRRNRNLFTSGEDNLVLRGVNLYGEKQWHLIADRFLPDRTINNISQRYSKLCYLLYKAHGIYIDDSGNLATPPKFESVDDLDDVAIGKLKKVDPPAIMNVHRWSPEEDLTLLKAVPLMGSMWAELKARLIPHRDRGHLRKRYQVLERRVKATVTRIVKNERLAIIKIVSPGKCSLKQIGKGKTNRSKLTSTRLFADNTKSGDDGIGSDPNAPVQEQLKHTSQPKSPHTVIPSIKLEKEDAMKSRSSIKDVSSSSNTDSATITGSSNIASAFPSLSSKRTSGRKLQGKKAANQSEDDHTMSQEVSASIDAVTSQKVDQNIRHALPASPSRPYYQYPMQHPPHGPHHAVAPFQHHNPYFAGYMQQLPPPGYPYHHPYLHKYPPPHHPYFNRNDQQTPWLSPSQNVDETSRAQFEKLASDGTNDWSRIGDIDVVVEDEVTIAGTQLTSLAKSPSIKLGSDKGVQPNDSTSRNDVAGGTLESNDGSDVSLSKGGKPGVNASFLANVINHSSSQLKYAGNGSFSSAATHPFTETTMNTPSEVGNSSTSSTPANIRMSLFADGFSNISTDLRMSQLSKFSPASVLNSRHPIIGENVDTFHFGDKSIDSYEVHHTFPSNSRLTDVATSIYQGDSDNLLPHSNDNGNNDSHTETFNILELATDLIALRDSPAKTSQPKQTSMESSNKNEDNDSTPQDRTEDSGKPQKSLFSQVVGKHGAEKRMGNNSKALTVKKSNVGKRQKLF